MTMTDEQLAELDAVSQTIHGEPFAETINKILCEYSAWVAMPNKDVAEKIAFAALVKATMITDCTDNATIDAQAATIAGLEAELEKTTKPHFWWDVDDSENGCDDITTILDNYDIGEVVEVSCARNLPNQWAVGYVTESGGFRGQTFATEAEAVAFAAERAALTGAA